MGRKAYKIIHDCLYVWQPSQAYKYSCSLYL